MALAKITAEVVWLWKLLSDFGFSQLNPTIIYSNSQSAIALSENPKYHSKKQTCGNSFPIYWGKSAWQTNTTKIYSHLWHDTDIFTKPLPRDKHIKCIQNLGMCLIPQDENVSSKHEALMPFHRPHPSSQYVGDILVCAIIVLRPHQKNDAPPNIRSHKAVGEFKRRNMEVYDD